MPFDDGGKQREMAFSFVLAFVAATSFYLGIRFERNRSHEYAAVAHDRAVVDLGVCQDALAVNDRILRDVWPGWGRHSWSEPMPTDKHSTPTPSPKDDLE